MGIMDNTAIERIASPDLGADAAALLTRYGHNDDVVFFLGRLVWQGEMIACVPALMTIALDPSRGRYARIAATRAVMSVGDEGLKDDLWENIANHPGPLDRHLLAELLDWAPPGSHSVELLLRTLDRLTPFERFEATGLGQALHGFIDRLPVMSDRAGDQPLARLVDGLYGYLDREPYIERRECHVSEPFAWLMVPALHAVDRLVGARAAQALEPAAIATLRKLPALRFWRGEDVTEYRTALDQNIPRWQELNDILYWTSAAETRASLARKGERLVDDWRFAFLGHFWLFAAEDFVRCVAWVSDKPNPDDRLVALSRCAQLYVTADRPAEWLALLRAAVSGQPELETTLEARIDPRPSPTVLTMESEHQDWERKREEKEQEEERHRSDWIRELKVDPNRVRNPVGLKPGDISGDQFHLMLSIRGEGVATDREQGADWRALVPEFGEAVAEAYRDAAIAHWRAYQPEPRSEVADTSSTPYSLIFGMAGLAIEAGAEANFTHGLSEDDARHALRYVTWELNGFPRWFESLYRAHPDIAFAAVRKELVWELERSVADTPTHRILHDILYHAPWLHAEVAPFLLDWLFKHDLLSADNLRYYLNILSGGVAVNDLARLAEKKLTGSAPADQRPRWFAIWVDTDPDVAIRALQTELEGLSEGDASDFAQEFVVGLLGDRHGTGSRSGAFRTAAHLKTLYILMHRYVRSAEDIERAGKGVYSPTLRDNAQDGRNRLFSMLSEVPGPETYAAIKALENEHPEPSYRRWMALRARERAIADSDEPLWTVEQINSFVSGL